MWLKTYVTATFLIIFASALGGSDDRFIKKYAMMKIYESCFGPEVVKQIRREMKQACMKCASFENPPPLPTPPQHQPQPSQSQSSLRPTVHVPLKTDTAGGIADPENTLFANAQSFDVDKLNQAILAYRPNSMPMSPFNRPYVGPGSAFYTGFPNPSGPMYYPGQFQQPSPFAAAAPYSFPFFAPHLYAQSRISRDMDIKGQLELISTKMSGRVRNVTCVMQELGYLDQNLEPNFEKIRERIKTLPVADELRGDMLDGIDFCQQFSQCVPDVSKDKAPLSKELLRPMFFFKCYKHKKLEACIMKDVREKYAGVSDDEFDGEMEYRRTGKSLNSIKKDEIDDLASSMYEFLYGSDSNIDLESMF